MKTAPEGAALLVSVGIRYAFLRLRRRRSRPRPASAVPNSASEAGSGTPRNVASKALVLPAASLMLKLEKGVVVEIVTRQFDWFATAPALSVPSSGCPISRAGAAVERNITSSSGIPILSNFDIVVNMSTTGPLTFPTYRLVPDSRWMLDLPARRVGARSAKRRTRGVAIFVLTPKGLSRFGFAQGTSPTVNVPDPGFVPIARNRSYAAYASCGTGAA